MLRPFDKGRFRPEAFFQPKSVLLVRDGSPQADRIAANLATFPGTLTVTTPANLASAPKADVAVMACAPLETAPALATLARIGITAAICTTPAPGLAEAARDARIAVLGPASFGVIVPAIGFNASTAHVPVRPGKVALISQSSALCRAVLDWAAPNGVGFSHIVGVGGNAPIGGSGGGFSLALDWLSRDPGTGAILLDIRNIRDRRSFLAAARAAARLRPVVAIRAGGRLHDPSGREDAVFDAALHRAGVLRVATLSEMMGAAETLTRARPPRTERLAIASNAIGMAHMAADAAVALGLPLLELDTAQKSVLRLRVPDGPADPGIVWTGAENPTCVAEAASMLAGVPATGGVIAILSPGDPGDHIAVDALVAARAAMRVPLLVCIPGETTAGPHRATLAAAGVPVFATPESAVRAFAQLVNQRRARLAAAELPPRRVLRLAPDQAAVTRILDTVRQDGRMALAQDEALAVLKAYGMDTVPSLPAKNPLAARIAADRLGFPAVVKRRRTDRPGQAGTGALALDLANGRAVERAAERLGPGPLIVQRQAGRGRELRIGVNDDPQFGPAIAFGLGGSAAGLLDDPAYELPPLNLPLARALIARTRVSALLGDWNDQAATDLNYVADALVRVSQLLLDHPDIGEIEINPLLATATGVQAIDAWIGLRPPGDTAAFAIAPYPAELSERFQAGPETLLIRPIRPEDAEAHIALFRRLTPEDVRYRFFNMLRELPPAQVVRLTEVDYYREMALVAVREDAQETIGVARLIIEPGTNGGEFAVIVEPTMKGRGVARRLMERLADWGRTRGLVTMTGQVLAENAPMLAFMRRMGARIHRLPDEPDVVEAVIPLE